MSARSSSLVLSTNHFRLNWAEVKSVETTSDFRESESVWERARLCCSLEDFDESEQCLKRTRDDRSRDRMLVMTRDRECRCLMRSRDTTIDDRRWSTNEGRRSLQKREEWPMWEGKRKRSGRATREGASLYLEKATSEAMQGVLPKTSAPSSMGSRFA